MTRLWIIGLVALGLAWPAGCDGPDPDPTTTNELALAGAMVDHAVCAPAAGGFTLESTNPYYPIDVGAQWVLAGEEDGEALLVWIKVMDETEEVAGVTTRIIRELEWVDGELVEASYNYVVEAADGTVCYFGEAVDDYEGGILVGHEGAWRADEPGHFPGILMPARVRPGLTFVMEGAPGIAEDEGKILGHGPVEVPAGFFKHTFRLRESNPLEGDRGDKVFAAGVGLLIDEELELIEK